VSADSEVTSEGTGASAIGGDDGAGDGSPVAADTPAMNDADASGLEFREVQRFRQWWLWLLLLPAALAPVGIFGYGMVQQLLLGRPWGDRPMSDTALAVVGPLAAVLGLGILGLFQAIKLTTEVRDDGLHIRFFPFRPRRFRFDEIHSCDARTYRPLAEFGGWGMRRGRGGQACSVSGSSGVQLQFVNGSKLLIGSQRADDLARAINRRR